MYIVVITRRSGVFPQMVSIMYDCQQCSQKLGPFEMDVRPHSCTNCHSPGPFKINPTLTKYGNYQKITLQESPGSVPPGRCTSIYMHIKDLNSDNYCVYSVCTCMLVYIYVYVYVCRARSPIQGCNSAGRPYRYRPTGRRGRGHRSIHAYKK